MGGRQIGLPDRPRALTANRLEGVAMDDFQTRSEGTSVKSSGEGMRSGANYIDSVRDDGRCIIHDGEVVRDVAMHPAFRSAVRSVARLWDIAADPANREIMTFPSPKTSKPVLRC